MTEIFNMFRIHQYNKKRKPWRNYGWTEKKKSSSRPMARMCLCLMVCLEAAVLFPRYEQTILHETQSLFSVSRETQLETERDTLYDGKAGETKEQGFSLDLKDGKVKLWQKVERVILKNPD